MKYLIGRAVALVSRGGTLYLRLCAPLKVRQQRLGHSDLRLTLNVYTQIASEDDEWVAAQLRELVTRNSLPKLSEMQKKGLLDSSTLCELGEWLVAGVGFGLNQRPSGYENVL